ncbi:MAG: PAS domain S-box protein, partial [Actinomycetota bacterium]|nr:PAS domain S-box protein [Actinomycetota bacterium]
MPEETVVKNILERSGNGSIHAEGLDGVRRLYVHKTLMGSEETGKVYVCVGFLEKEIYGPINRALAVDLAYLGLFVALVILSTYWLSGFFILTPIRNLLRASRELGEGNLEARTGLGDAVGEIGLLARSFDRMAEFLQARSEERDRAEEELRKNREQLSAIVNTVPVGIIIFDSEGRVTFANPSAKSIFGLARGEILGSFYDRLFFEVADMDGNPVPREELPFLRVMGGESELLDLEYSVICRDGSRKTLSFNAAPLRDEKGDVAGVIASVEDVTERNAARSRMERLGRFYAVLSDVNRAVVRFRERDALLNEICRILVDEGLFTTAWIEMVNPSTGRLRPVAHAGIREEYVEGIKLDADESREGRNPSEMVVREGRPLVCNDIENDSRMAPWRDKALASGYQS